MRNKQSADQYLVVEQKGWRWVLVGLAIASFFSLTFRAIFSPRRIQYEIERALSMADPRIQSSIEGASLSLADGWWPRLAIVIDKFKVQSSDPCLFEAKASIEQLVLPVALSSLMDRTLVFKKIEVGLLNLEMRARREGCGGATVSIPPLPQTLQAVASPLTEALPKIPEVPPSPAPSASPTPSPSAQAATTAAPKSEATPEVGTAPVANLERPPLVQTMSVESSLLQKIVFHHVQLHFVEWPQFRWHLKQVEVQLPQETDRKTRVEGLVTLTSDQKRFLFQGVHAHLSLELDAEMAAAKIRGAWREGRVDVTGQWSPNRKDFRWTGSFKQVPWSQLIVLAQALGQTGPLPASSQAWVSADVDWNHDTSLAEKITVDNGHIEGEFGDFLIGKVIAERHLDARVWSTDPYKVLAKEVDLDILTKMMGWSEPPRAFDRLGLFDGEAQFTENQMVSMAGHWKDLSVVFSNRGLREFQTIKNIDLEMNGRSNRWSGLMKNIQLKDGDWKGDIAMSLDQNEKTVSLETEFRQLKLSPDVEELMTLNGNLSAIEGKVKVIWVDGITTLLDGFLKLDSGVINEVVVEKARLEFQGTDGVFSGKAQVQTMDWPVKTTEFWPPILPSEMDSLQVKNVMGQFQRRAEALTVSNLQGLLVDLKSRFYLNGGWKDDSTLFGQMQLKSDRKVQSFQLSGTRKQPQWISPPQ